MSAEYTREQKQKIQYNILYETEGKKMKIFQTITDLIGSTPLLELRNYENSHALSATILAKLEYFNPAGSVKDRIAKAMIDDVR